MAAKAPKQEKPSEHTKAILGVDTLRALLGKFPHPERFEQLLLGIKILIEQDPEEVASAEAVAGQ